MKTIYDLTISTLTPLHIGDGDKLEQNFDYVYRNRATWVINQDALSRDKLLDEDDRLREDLLEHPPGTLLADDDFRLESGLFHYRLRGREPGAATIQTHIKDVKNRPYLPGSSLKGALRTLLFRHAYEESNFTVQPDRMTSRRNQADDWLDGRLLGRDPNHDLLRALHVSDTRPVDANESLRLYNIRVFGSGSVNTPIPLEALKPNVAFTATLTIDNYLFENEQAQRKLNFRNRREWLTGLPSLANAQAAARFEQELDAFGRLGAGSRAVGAYNRLDTIRDSLGDNQFFLQVGWGGGWESKTLSYLVPTPDLDALIDKYRLARGHRRSGDPFPRTRRAVGTNTEPLAPLGWLLVEMTPR